MAKTLYRNDVHNALGFKLGKDYTHTTGIGWQYTDDAVIRMAPLLDQIGVSDLREYINRRLEPSKQRQAERAAREAQKQAAKKAAEESAKRAEQERQRAQAEKLDAELTQNLKAAGATDADVERLLPELRAKTLLERAGKIAKKFEREAFKL